MKSFQQIAPTISAWLALFTKRFLRMNRGWLRLLVVVYVLAMAGIFIAAANSTPSSGDEIGMCGAFVFWLYWPAIRLGLWINDGFKKEKKHDAINFDSGRDNRNN